MAAILSCTIIPSPLQTDRAIVRGTAGEQVTFLQMNLAGLGVKDAPAPAPNACFDADTQTALLHYQLAAGLRRRPGRDEPPIDVDAVEADPATLARLANDVTDLQSGLFALGFFTDPADGLFGETTAAAVSACRAAYGLPAGRIADPRTFAHVTRRIRDTKRRLAQLGLLGEDEPIDGRFSPAAAEALAAFRAARSLPDGPIDALTLARLSAETPDLPGLPGYGGGCCSAVRTHDCGALLPHGSGSRTSQLLLVSHTTEAEFDAWCAAVEAEGWRAIYGRLIDGNRFVKYLRGGRTVYTYYTPSAQEVHIILDDNSDCTETAAFGYTYAKQPGERTTAYMYGLMMDPDGIDFQYNGHTRPNCGHMFLLKMADDSIFLIDGGDLPQMSDPAAEELLRFLREITGGTEKIRINCWFFSHAHIDHFRGFQRFLGKYGEQFEIERVMYNFASVDDVHVTRLMQFIADRWPDARYHMPHTGEQIQLADVGIEVLYTREDMQGMKEGNTLGFVSRDFNDSSTVLRFTFDGKTFLLPGDLANRGAAVMTAMYSPETLKSDVLQVAHHGWNDLRALYEAVRPTISLYPQSSGGAVRGLGGYAATVHETVCRCTAGGIYYAGDETAGVEAADGTVRRVYTHPVVGVDYTGWKIDE